MNANLILINETEGTICIDSIGRESSVLAIHQKNPPKQDLIHLGIITVRHVIRFEINLLRVHWLSNRHPKPAPVWICHPDDQTALQHTVDSGNSGIVIVAATVGQEFVLPDTIYIPCYATAVINEVFDPRQLELSIQFTIAPQPISSNPIHQIH